MITFAKNGSLFIACAILAITFWMAQDFIISSIITLVFMIYLIGNKKLPTYTGSFIFLGLIIVAARAATMMTSMPLVFLACAAAISYWDLDAFEQRLKPQEPSELTRKMVRSHCTRLLGSLGVGYLIALAGVFITVNLSFGWAIILGLAIFSAIYLIIKTVITPIKTS